MKNKYNEYIDGKYRVRELGQYIEAYQARCFGKPTFKGTRVLVHQVLESLAEPKQKVESVANDYHLPVKAVQEALHLAANIYHFDLRLPDPYPDEKPTSTKYYAVAERTGVIADKADK